METSVIVSLIFGGTSLSITLAFIVYNAGKNRGFEEAQKEKLEKLEKYTDKELARVESEVRKIINGLPTRIAVVEQIVRDVQDREARHKLEWQRENDDIHKRIDKKQNRKDLEL